MDLSSVLEIVKGMNFWSVVTGIISGILLTKLLDEILFLVLSKFWPEKYVQIFLGWVKQFDDQVIDKIKEKYPKVGSAIEMRLTSALEKMQEIIEDK